MLPWHSSTVRSISRKEHIAPCVRRPAGQWAWVCLLLIVFSGCDKLFDITPYDAAPPKDLRLLNAAAAGRITEGLGGADGPITIGLLSDPHYHYADMADIVSHMRADASIDLVVVPGDLTDQGLVGEYEWFARGMQALDVPWIAVIGNHDHLGNGSTVYEAMFGPRNFVIDLARHRFIFFDDTAWESEQPPDIAWLEQALAGVGERIPVVFTHIPPFSDQLTGPLEEQMRELFADAMVPVVVHGHQNRFAFNEFYWDEVKYLCAPWPEDRSYAKLTLDGRQVQVEHVKL